MCQAGLWCTLIWLSLSCLQNTEMKIRRWPFVTAFDNGLVGGSLVTCPSPSTSAGSRSHSQLVGQLGWSLIQPGEGVSVGRPSP